MPEQSHGANLGSLKLANCRRHFYPETAAGGYTRVDGTVEFYGRINALLRPEMVVLDYGAGRGMGVQDDAVPFRRELRSLKGKCRQLIGADVDPAVLDNPGLQQAYLIGADGRLPLESESVDLIVSDNTFEHIADPGLVSSELDRVLKPGGWLCARTPNRWGYIAIGGSLVPNRWHASFLRRLQPGRKEIDVFPTIYRLNTGRALKRYFPPAEYDDHSYRHYAEPNYFGGSRLLWALALFGFRLLPEALAPTWMIFVRKRPAVSGPAD